MALLRRRIAGWLDGVDEELRPPLRSAFAGKPKSFRPLTVFAAHRAVNDEPPSDTAITRALAVELAHNMSLIVDDILDESELRRGIATIQSGYGRLPALMASGYLIADAFEMLREDPFGSHYIGELLRRLASAECLQWRLRRQPLGTEDWRYIAGEDTGSMFEVCAVLGGGSRASARVRPPPGRPLSRMRRRRRPARPRGPGRRWARRTSATGSSRCRPPSRSATRVSAELFLRDDHDPRRLDSARRRVRGPGRGGRAGAGHDRRRGACRGDGGCG